MADHAGMGRREFMRAGAATVGVGAATLAWEAARAADPEKPPVPLVTLGKTGQQVTRLGMGSSWAVADSFVQRAIAAGVRFIDTSETYERGRAEKTIGTVLARTGKRKDVYLVTKNNRYGRLKGDARAKSFATQLDASLERLQTDYIDCYYMHGVEGHNIDVFTDPAVIKAYEALKKAGKIKFAGFSCHDEMLPELIEAAAACGWIDQMMVQFNFRTMDGDKIRRALDKAGKANIGIVAMKTQGGAAEVRVGEKDTKLDGFVGKGFNVHQAAIQAVFADERVHTVVSEMTNFDMLRDNMAAAANPLGAKEARLLEEHRERTAGAYCQGCTSLCQAAAGGVPVGTVLRYLRYHDAYGKRAEARALYAALGAADRAVAHLTPAADAACPHGLPVTALLHAANRRRGQVCQRGGGQRGEAAAGRSAVVLVVEVGGVGHPLGGPVGDAVGAVDPAAEVDELAALGAEREGREVAEGGDLAGLAADRALQADHDDEPPDGVGVGEGEGDAVGVGLGVLDSAGLLADLSASAPFLYDSLR